MTTTTETTDIRIQAWAFGRQCGSMAVAYRLLENDDPTAKRVFAALRRNEWGVEAAWKSGLRGEDIVARNPRTGVEFRYTAGGRRYDSVPPRVARRPVAENGGTV